MLSLLRYKYLQFLEHRRQVGFFAAVWITFYKVEEMVPTVKDLNDLRTIPVPENRAPSILDLGPENFFAYALDYPLRSRKARADYYFSRGYRTFVMAEGQRVVGDMWYVTPKTARSPVIHPHVQWFGLKLAEKDAYLFDLQVDAGQRGGGLTTSFHNRVLEILRDRGFRKAYGCYVANNLPALWMHRLIGYRELPRCIVRRFFQHEIVRPKA
ncbi:MAG: hypothetical protein JXB25_00615 [Deltaproteobacteria bacterium]|nr:hypothetical protein [Deltaproteobacteria bacterium]